MTDCEDVKPSRLLLISEINPPKRGWHESKPNLSMSNRIDCVTDSNSTANHNSAESDTISLSNIRSPLFHTNVNHRQQLSPAFQRLSPRSKLVLFRSQDFSFPAIDAASENEKNPCVAASENIQNSSLNVCTRYAEMDRSTYNLASNNSQTVAPSKPSLKSKSKPTEIKKFDVNSNLSKQPIPTSGKEWTSTSTRGNDFHSKRDRETNSTKFIHTKLSEHDVEIRNDEIDAEILLDQSRSPAIISNGKSSDRRCASDISSSCNSTKSASEFETNRNHVLPRYDAAPAVSNVRNVGKTNELEALKKKNKVASMCKNFETENAPHILSRVNPVVEKDIAKAEEASCAVQNGNTPVLPNKDVMSVLYSKCTSKKASSDRIHQTVWDNVNSTTISPPIQAIKASVVENTNVNKKVDNIIMCATKDDTNNNDNMPDNNKSSDNNSVVKNGDAIPSLNLRGFVGFDSLPYQLVKKCHNDGFQFNLLCVGETGMGKTTLIESLFNRKMDFEPCNSELKTVELRTKFCEVEESGVRVKLRVVETAGFGDQLDKEKSAKVIVDYINEQFEAYLREELKIKRFLSAYDDTRIHACLYFISPTGHGLKALDVVTMRELSKRANVIPVIAKADTACKDELIRFKQKIMSELKANNIEIYQFPVDDEAVRKENTALNALLPFAVVGSCEFVTKEDGRPVRVRNYVWGRVEVENEEHCDFVKLREALLRINEDSLRERTHTILYEAYRRQRLQEMRMGDGDAGPRMMEATLKRKKEFAAEVQRRDEQFKLEFETRVQRKEADLKHREDGLHIRQRDIEEKFRKEMLEIDNEIARIRTEQTRLLTTGGGKKQRK